MLTSQAPRKVAHRISPFLWAALLYLAALSVVWIDISHIDKGVQLYSLDDPYIHLAIAKNLVQHHVYGVTSAEFSPASSSVVWPFLLAGLMEIFGVHAWLAFALNAFFALLLLFLVNRWLVLWNLSAIQRLCALSAIVLLAPLATLTTVGLEHILHAITAGGLLVYAVEQWRTPTRRGFLLLLLWAALATSTRYEAAFEVACVCALLLFSKRVLEALSTAAAGFLPILCFGLFSLHHLGTHFLPNSLLVKTQGGLDRRLAALLYNLAYFHRELLSLAFVALISLTVLSIARHRGLTAPGAAGILVIGATISQLALAKVGQLGRYEAFLVVLFILSIALFATELSHTSQTLRRLQIAFIGLGIALLVPRAGVLDRYNGASIQSIYLQQFQMARFFATQYPDTPVAINDIGAVDFYGRAPNFDIFGLASVKVLNAKLAGQYTADGMDTFTEASGVRIVAIYKDWFPAPPDQWTFAGGLSLRCGDRHRSVAGQTVAFYVTHPSDLATLRARLAAFATSLPPGVSVIQNAGTTYCVP